MPNKIKSLEQFSAEVFKTNPDVKIIGDYKGVSEKILVEDSYGICNVFAKSLLKCPPSINVALDKTSYWKNKYKIEEFYNYKYDYSKTLYERHNKKVIITCPVHGDFLQTPGNHILGGCRKCGNLNKKGTHGSLNVKTAERNKELWCNKKAYFYYVNMKSENENFYKIGITTKGIEKRFRKLMHYSYEVLEYIDTDLYSAIYLEEDFLKLVKNYRYLPNFKFDGYTECFSKSKKEIEDLNNFYNFNLELENTSN